MKLIGHLCRVALTVFVAVVVLYYCHRYGWLHYVGRPE